MKLYSLLLVALVGLCSPVAAASLTTTFASNNGNSGIMFDVVADKPVTIEAFNINAGDGDHVVEIYTKSGTFVGSEGVAANWTLVATQAITNPAVDVPSPAIVLNVPVALGGGARQGFYIRLASGSVNYTNGDGVGTLEAQDDNLRIFEGSGVAGSFGAATASRIPNVTITYAPVPNALSTAFAGGNAASGIMFDVVAKRPVSLSSLQFALDTATAANVEIYTKPGTFVDFESDPAPWTSLGVAAVSSPVAEVSIPAPFTFASPPSLAAGERRAFYIRVAAGGSIAYSNGTLLGSVAAEDAVLQILEGSGISGTFGGTAGTPRIPNVTLRYAASNELGAPSLTLIGSSKLRTTTSSVAIFGLATDDSGAVSVTATFKGKKRKTTRNVSVASNGLFRFKLKPLPGRNVVTFVAKDASGKTSPLRKVTVLRGK